jgi:hypothetical protein
MLPFEQTPLGHHATEQTAGTVGRCAYPIHRSRGGASIENGRAEKDAGAACMGGLSGHRCVCKSASFWYLRDC